MARRRPFGRIAATAALATAFALLVAAPPASAADARDDERLTLMRAAHAGGSTSAAGVTAAQTASACFSDPTGDVVDERTGTPATQAAAPRADIVEHCAAYVENLVLRVRVAEPSNPHTDPAWQDATFVGWFLDTDGDGDGDFFVAYHLNPAGHLVTTVQRLEEGSAVVTCADEPAVYDGETFTTGPIAPSCLDGETSVAVAAATFYDVDGDEDGPLLHDTAPDPGTFTAAVERTTTCEDALPGPFADRARVASVHGNAVDCLYARGIVRGTDVSDVRHFLPVNQISRGQFSAFTFRTLMFQDVALPPAQTPRFQDVAGGSTFDEDIHRLAAADILLGVTPQLFRPNDPVRRDQTASILVRSLSHARGTPVTPAQPGTYFSDTVGNHHEANIDAAFEEGLVTGFVAPNAQLGIYNPSFPTSRQQMASVINRFIDNLEAS